MRTALALSAMLLCAAPAAAHEWYDYECCSKNDCRQTTLGEVDRRDDGWFVNVTGELIPFDDFRVRRSQDAIMHICLVRSYAASNRGQMITRCLYVPEMGG
jgi:hypothetical protein